MFRNSCLVCNSPKLARIMDLGMHPFADTFIPRSRLSEPEPIYPLLCDLCQNCGHIQTSCITDPNSRYASYDYSYTSSNSGFSKNHWQNYAKEVSLKINLKPRSFIIEVGSNDGFLAEQFQNQGYKVLGVDPSPFMADLAKKRNVKTWIGLFNSVNSKKIEKRFGKAQLIVANNVFNHADSPLDFLKAAKNLLAENGTFIFESPYWLYTFESKKFDQIYHEHVSYFTVTSAKKLLEEAGFKISDVQLVDYHGGSIRVFAKRNEYIKKDPLVVKKMISKEKSLKLFDKKIYFYFMEHILRQRNTFLKKIYDIKSKGNAIVAVGAAAKGNTFLNFYNLNHLTIDYVTDSSLYKCGKYTPLTRIPIEKDDIFSNYKEVYALILSWNISSQLKEKLYKINKKIKFISLP